LDKDKILAQTEIKYLVKFYRENIIFKLSTDISFGNLYHFWNYRLVGLVS
jgi:hypothetical protein